MSFLPATLPRDHASPLGNGNGQNNHHHDGPAFDAWRSPLVKETPLVEPSSLPLTSPVQNKPQLSPTPNLLHPAFLPPCEHSSTGGGEMHAHAFDLLSLAANKAEQENRSPPTPAAPQVVPSSVPARAGFLTATRPNGVNANTAGPSLLGSAPKPRRMSSSTTGALGRGKLGLTGENAPKESRPAPAPLTRRPTLGSSPTPQLFDFTKTDRRPAPARTVSASVPSQPYLRVDDDMELDMEFGEGDDEDDGEIGSGSGSAGEEEGDWKKLALGTGSGGVKGRRKGMVFKCETCSKEYRHPSCLVKHRWEHSPHWKESTQLAMSKHQQVQMLEAAAILAHLDPQANGRALPNDKSLWPAMLSPPEPSSGFLSGPPRRMSNARDLRSPPSSNAPLTPSSFGAISEHLQRKSSPESDGTTSSMGAGEPFVKAAPQIGRTPSFSSSLPRQMADLRFGSFNGTPGSPSSFNNPLAAGVALSAGSGVSPDPRMRIGGGMFGTSLNMARPSSSVRSGVADLPEADEDEEEDRARGHGYANGNGHGHGHARGHGHGHGQKPAPATGFGLKYPTTNGFGGPHKGRKKSSSEEAEERRKDEEYGMAMDLEL